LISPRGGANVRFIPIRTESAAMKAIRISKTGGPEAMTFEDVPDPVAGPGEVLVRHEAIGINFIDTYFRSGLYPAPTPFILGNEAAGKVVALGEGVKGFRIGDSVAYVASLGAYAEMRAVKAELLVKTPKGVGPAIAASLMLKGMTAEYLLHRTFSVKSGQAVLVHAAAGATGQIVAQWAKALGATVIGTVGSPEKAKIAKKLGCDLVIDYSAGGFAAKVVEFTKGRKCDVVYDGVGKTTFLESLDCLKPFGLMVSFGNASGPVDPFSPALLGQKGSLYLTRPSLFAHAADPKVLAAMARRMFAAYLAGSFTAPKPRSFKLADAAEAHRVLEARGTTGPMVLLP
jgi:NADPH:quinone reductase